MVRSGRPDSTDGQQSLGELVALAAKDISSLVRYEITLAKSEMKMDLRRTVPEGDVPRSGNYLVRRVEVKFPVSAHLLVIEREPRPPQGAHDLDDSRLDSLGRGKFVEFPEKVGLVWKSAEYHNSSFSVKNDSCH